jgi:hypothetical protein
LIALEVDSKGGEAPGEGLEVEEDEEAQALMLSLMCDVVTNIADQKTKAKTTGQMLAALVLAVFP